MFGCHDIDFEQENKGEAIPEAEVNQFWLKECLDSCEFLLNQKKTQNTLNSFSKNLKK